MLVGDTKPDPGRELVGEGEGEEAPRPGLALEVKGRPGPGLAPVVEGKPDPTPTAAVEGKPDLRLAVEEKPDPGLAVEGKSDQGLPPPVVEGTLEAGPTVVVEEIPEPRPTAVVGGRTGPGPRVAAVGGKRGPRPTVVGPGKPEPGPALPPLALVIQDLQHVPLPDGQLAAIAGLEVVITQDPLPCGLWLSFSFPVWVTVQGRGGVFRAEAPLVGPAVPSTQSLPRLAAQALVQNHPLLLQPAAPFSSHPICPELARGVLVPLGPSFPEGLHPSSCWIPPVPPSSRDRGVQVSSFDLLSVLTLKGSQFDTQQGPRPGFQAVAK